MDTTEGEELEKGTEILLKELMRTAQIQERNGHSSTKKETGHLFILAERDFLQETY